MTIGGLQKFSLIEYPGKISCIIFTQRCNIRCYYCYNPELVCPALFKTPISETEVFNFLKTRVGKLDAVVISGGEPTLQYRLLDFIKGIKDLGFLVKVHTNGSNPSVIAQILPYIDYITMDIKGPFEKYKAITRSDIDVERYKRSINLIRSVPIRKDFRTTRCGLLTDNDIETIKSYIPNETHTIQEEVKNTFL